MHWKHHLKFPDEARLTPEAKDLICRLLCDVEHRLGTGGADQIKVCSIIFKTFHSNTVLTCKKKFNGTFTRLIPGSKMWYGTNSMKWRQHLSQRSMGNLIHKIL